MSDLYTSDTSEEEVIRPRRQRRRRRKRSRFGSFVAVLASLAVIGAVLGGIYYGGNAVLNSVDGLFGEPEDFPGPGTGEVPVTIEEGATLRAMGATLVEAGVVASQDAFIAAADQNPDARSIQPGNYVLRSEMSAADAVAALVSGAGGERVSLAEGLRVRQTVERLAETSGFTVEELQAAVDAATLPEYTEGDPEGFLFPASYGLGGDVTPESLVAAMVARFEQAATEVDLVNRAAALGYTPREIVTVASIVQREVRREEDMPRVAEVIYNRLTGACAANGVVQERLQMDSTVHYAFDDYTTVYTTPEQRQSDSPYNTYRVSGLPPGPIASPGEAALAAALNPSSDGYCYFVAVNLETGETAFGVTPEDQQANEAQLDEYCRESDLC
ncbi:endolytic transglycosylase MltG [Jiangella rhizosphaerae]|uniref:Endolytic murein transglycosylase n=1 Tax=Jiangella rhizosphaerae TaxID=2293569 RepID=A0A418KLG6_9ACTN|nr:endolytic transglycosylase MltG [Jiangella rhizosphaerae]RIQ18385.1 endolytic transglycosylase MltG [Jiangella rhizosphaerae]